MCRILIDAHKCLDTAYWAYELKDNLALTMIADQISVLAGVKVAAVGWESTSDYKPETWCRFWAEFPTKESAVEFSLRWQ